MIDRFGKTINVGWAAHEILWLEAALTLRATERRDAFQFIAEKTGRGYLNVQAKAEAVASEQRHKAAQAAAALRQPAPVAWTPQTDRCAHGPRKGRAA